MGNLLRLILTPILYVVGAITVNGYKLLFSWWLDPHVGRKADERFAQKIRQELYFLFEQHGGRVIRNQLGRKRTMDNVQVAVEAGNLRLRFSYGLGDLTTDVASKHFPLEWHELSLVAMVTETPQGLRSRTSLRGLNDVAKLLQDQWDALNDALSIEHYPTIRQRLEGVYGLSGDVLWHEGIRVPAHLRADLPRRSRVRF